MKRLAFMFIAVLTVLILTGCPGVGPDPVTYAIGDTGPGNGIIFYDDTIGYDFDGDGTIQEDEKNLIPGKRYLEAAPNTWSGGTEDPGSPWGDYGTNIPGLDDIADADTNADTLTGTVGNGAANTSVIVTHMESESITGTPAQLCAAYTGGNKPDWFLASIGELVILHSERDTVGGFPNNGYWSSSEIDNLYSWYVSFGSGTVFPASKQTPAKVRPVRAF